MRYGDGGGLNAAGRQRREQVRHRAAAMFAGGATALQVAAALQVSTKSAYEWRRAWAVGGVQALAPKGPPGPDPVLSDAQLARLKQRLEQAASSSTT